MTPGCYSFCPPKQSQAQSHNYRGAGDSNVIRFVRLADPATTTWCNLCRDFQCNGLHSQVLNPPRYGYTLANRVILSATGICRGHLSTKLCACRCSLRCDTSRTPFGVSRAKGTSKGIGMLGMNKGISLVKGERNLAIWLVCARGFPMTFGLLAQKSQSWLGPQVSTRLCIGTLRHTKSQQHHH